MICEHRFGQYENIGAPMPLRSCEACGIVEDENGSRLEWVNHDTDAWCDTCGGSGELQLSGEMRVVKCWECKCQPS